MNAAELMQAAVESAVSYRFGSESDWGLSEDGFTTLLCRGGRAGFLSFSELCQAVADASGRACYMLQSTSSSTLLILDADLSSPLAPRYQCHGIGEAGEPFYPSDPIPDAQASSLSEAPAGAPAPELSFPSASDLETDAPAPEIGLFPESADIAAAPALSDSDGSRQRAERALGILRSFGADLRLEDLGALARALADSEVRQASF